MALKPAYRVPTPPLAAAARPWLYARVDLVETVDGPVLMELELIEPDLFLTFYGAARLAEELVKSVEEMG